MILPRLVLDMGMSGCGQSTFGRHLAEGMSCSFVDANDFHPPSNRACMVVGQTCVDAMR